jgi:hypothetical protein
MGANKKWGCCGGGAWSQMFNKELLNEQDGEMIHQDDHFTITQSRGSPAYKVDLN